MVVSVIISFYQRVSHLKCCLDALCQDSEFIDEVVVTDDGSDADTVRQVDALVNIYPFPVRHVWQPKDGFRLAAARNNGIRSARGDYLIFLDCDLLVLPEAIRVHLNLARQGRYLAGFKKDLSEDQTQTLFETGLERTDIESIYNGLPEDNLKHDHFKFVTRTWRIRLGLASPRKQTLGGHYSIFRKDLESVNGYDEQFVGWGGEDIDLGIRLAMAGVYGRSVIRKARVLHMWHSREQYSDNWQKGTNMAYFNRQRIKPVCNMGLRQLKPPS